MAALAQPIPSGSQGKGPDLGGGAVAGISIAVVIATSAIIFFCAYISLRRRRNRELQEEKSRNRGVRLDVEQQANG